MNTYVQHALQQLHPQEKNIFRSLFNFSHLLHSFHFTTSMVMRWFLVVWIFMLFFIAHVVLYCFIGWYS